MIQYTLKCAEGHVFDSWFQSAAAFDKLAASGMVTCVECGSTRVEKAIMAPRVRTGRKAVSPLGEAEPPAQEHSARPEQVERRDAPTAGPTGGAPVPTTASAAQPPAEQSEPSRAEVEAALKKMRETVEANSDYVGDKFVDEARAMHLGEAPERAIYGEAKLEDAKELINDGVPVMPLPFIPGRKTN